MKNRNRIKNNFWFNFWYKYNYPKNIVYGGGKQGYYSFRNERLIYILFAILGILIIFT